jgi:2-C-methyl-D-erythritol 4-phosphate cytidylyltransferase
MTSLTWSIIIANGKAESFSTDVETAFLTLGSKPVLTYSLTACELCPDIDGVVIVAPKDRVDSVRGLVQMFGCYKVKSIVPGTSQRLTSVLNGMEALDEKVTTVVLHDAARACVTPLHLSETVKSAKRYGSGVLATKVTTAIKLVEKGNTVTESLSQDTLWNIHTPQAFKTDMLRKALKAAQKRKKPLGDDSEALELIRQDTHIVPTTDLIIRISGPRDLNVSELLVRR